MLSLPDDWDYSLAGLCSISKESRDGIRAILNELKKYHKLTLELIERGYINSDFNFENEDFIIDKKLKKICDFIVKIYI